MWDQQQVSFYRNHYDNIGEPATLRDILYWKFQAGLDAIVAMRKLDPADPEYDKKKKELKKSLPGFTPSALLATREAGNITITKRTGLIQFDIDTDLFDLDELKACIFNLPFVAWVGLSCSGRGIYALVSIAEPDRQREYVEHCFKVFQEYGIPIDTSKGRNPHDLRYVSYDSNPLFRDDPQPLRIKQFKTNKRAESKPAYQNQSSDIIKERRLQSAVNEIMAAQVGQRWQTVQKWAYTIGGLRDKSLLSVIEQAIKNNSAFAGMEDKYLRCAADCFTAGELKPLNL